MSTCILFIPLLCACFFVCAPGTSALSTNRCTSVSNCKYFAANRPDVLNLLNHPLQLQLATGDLPLGSFRRLVTDRATILEGLRSATATTFPGLLDDDILRHNEDSRQWLEAAETAGKTIAVPGMQCYNCGGEHLNIDCPDDAGTSAGALALKSVLESHGVAGAVAVLRSYGFCCSRLLDAVDACSVEGETDATSSIDMGPYKVWIEAHAVRWSSLADVCEASINGDNKYGSIRISPSSYSIHLPVHVL